MHIFSCLPTTNYSHLNKEGSYLESTLYRVFTTCLITGWWGDCFTCPNGVSATKVFILQQSEYKERLNQGESWPSLAGRLCGWDQTGQGVGSRVLNWTFDEWVENNTSTSKLGSGCHWLQDTSTSQRHLSINLSNFYITHKCRLYRSLCSCGFKNETNFLISNPV